MASTTTKGGGQLAVVHTIAANHSSIGTNPVILLDLPVSTDLQRDEKGFWNTVWDQIKDDEELNTFLETAAPVNDDTGGEEIELEGGTKVGGATGASPDYFVTIYGPENSAAKVKIWQGVMKFASDSGSWKMEAGKMNRPKLSATSQKVLAELDGSTAILSSRANSAGGFTHEVGSRGKVKFLPKS